MALSLDPRAALFAWLVAAAGSALACPVDVVPREAGVLLTTQVADAAPSSLRRSDLDSLPQRTVSIRRTVEGSGSRDEQSLAYGGWLLRDVLARAGFGESQRGSRTWIVEAVATDGYRAVFSWGELYNSEIGGQVYVVHTQDGKALDAAAGPLALRSLADLRPGPRHVRNLCALLVRPLR